MSDLISRSALLQVMDKRYKEKKDFVQDNLAEGFLQMEKLIKEQPTVEAIPKEKVQEIMEKLEERKELHKELSKLVVTSEKAKELEFAKCYGCSIEIVKEVSGLDG